MESDLFYFLKEAKENANPSRQTAIERKMRAGMSAGRYNT